MFKISQLLIAAVLVTACASPTKTSPGDSNMETQIEPANIQLPVEGEMPDLEGAGAWLNSKPLSRKELRGKVVLVQFWTYTCINWLRTEPYIRAWAEKYKDKGLVVIGVHTPEFEFEKDAGNIQRAVTAMNINYPVAVDSDYRVWSAFDNHYWPALYFIDAKGQIRHHQFGEGDYEQSEKIIKQLLAEARGTSIDQAIVPIQGVGPEAAPDWSNLRSQENYVGYDRTQMFISTGGAVRDRSAVYNTPAKLELDQWALAGDWTISRNAILLNRANGRIVYRFHARDLHLVMGPIKQGVAVRFRVLIDSRPPGAAHGIDIDEQGYGTVADQRLYQLIRQPQPFADRVFEIEFLDPGIEVFVFTFG